MQKKLRLRHAGDFARLRREGKSYRHPYIILSMATNDLPHNRYGFITAKRLGKAVVRNRTRRLLREAMRLLDPHLRQGYDIVVVARPHAVNQPFHEIQHAVNHTCQRAKLIAKQS